MSLWKIAWRSIQQRSLASLLTGLSMVLGVMLVVAVLVVNGVVYEAFTRNPSMGFHMVVGAKGGDYQLVLNTIYHLSRPVENIPFSYYRKFTSDPCSAYELAVVEAPLAEAAGKPPTDAGKLAAMTDAERIAKAAELQQTVLAALAELPTAAGLPADEQAELTESAAQAAPLGTKLGPLKKLQRECAPALAELRAKERTPEDQPRYEKLKRLLALVDRLIDLREFADKTERAIPYCLGDNVQGFRVVGTIPEVFDPKFEYMPGRNGGPGRTYSFSEGRNFEADHFFEGVIGATVARQTGLKVGDTFSPTHSFAEDGHVHEDAFTVVGILAPTGTPNDRAVFINMEGFYRLEGHAKEDAAISAAQQAETAHEDHGHAHDAKDHGHAHDAKDHGHDAPKSEPAKSSSDAKSPSGASGCHEPVAAEDADAGPDACQAAEPAQKEPAQKDHGHAHDEHAHSHDDHGHSHSHGDHAHEFPPLPEPQREVTAVLVRTKHPVAADLAAIELTKLIQKGRDAQAASPVRVIEGLFQILVAPVQNLLFGLAVVVVLVAGIGILVSMYTSMFERRKEIAVMRALGASRGTVLCVVMLESLILSLAGGLGGWVLGHALTSLVSHFWLTSEFGVTVGFFELVGFPLGPVWVPLEGLLVGGLIALSACIGYIPAMSAYRTDVAKCLSASP